MSARHGPADISGLSFPLNRISI